MVNTGVLVEGHRTQLQRQKRSLSSWAHLLSCSYILSAPLFGNDP